MTSVASTTGTTAAGTTNSPTVVNASNSSAATSSLLGLTSGTLSSAGIGSGLNVSSIVSQLIAAAQAPEQQQITTESQQLATVSAGVAQVQGSLSSLQSAVSSLETANSLNLKTASSSASNVLTASATGNVASGNYSVTVSQLAQAQQLTSAAFAGGATATVGTGTLTIASGNSSFSVNIDGTDNTLTGIASAINNSASNPGITATIVNGSSGSYLMLTGANTGASNAMTVTASGGDGGLSQLSYAAGSSTNGLQVTQAAQDAQLTINGIAVSSASNTVTSAISGLTLNILQTQTSTPVMVNIATDTTGITNAVNGFVTAYNSIADTLTSLTGYNSSSNTAGALQGDAMANGISSQLQRIVGSVVSGATAPYNSLASLGITMNTSGDLQVDSTQLQNALTANPSAVSNVLAGTNGIATQLATFTNQELNGDIAARNTLISQQQANISGQSQQLSARMAILQASYTQQFSSLDTLLSTMQSTSNFLTQQMNALTGTTSSNTKVG